MDLTKTVVWLLLTLVLGVVLFLTLPDLELGVEVVGPSEEQWRLLEGLASIYVCVALYCAVAGELTGNVSQVDRLWSVIPAVYALYAAHFTAASSARVNLMAALVCVWAVRLTYNFGRRGGYSSWLPWRGEEDYRWEVP